MLSKTPVYIHCLLCAACRFAAMYVPIFHRYAGAHFHFFHTFCRRCAVSHRRKRKQTHGEKRSRGPKRVSGNYCMMTSYIKGPLREVNRLLPCGQAVNWPSAPPCMAFWWDQHEATCYEILFRCRLPYTASVAVDQQSSQKVTEKI